VRAHVRARLLGLRLLRLDADVVLVPAAVLVPEGRARTATGAHAPQQETLRGSDPECLWWAHRLLAESEELLQGVRRDASVPPPR
jgi:hypothetical protein